MHHLLWGPAVVVALLVSLPARTLLAQAVPTADLARGTLSFDARATLGAFTGVTSTMTGHLVGAPELAGVRGWVEAQSKTMTTKNGHRDRDMASSMEFDKFPTMRFTITSVTPGRTDGDSTEVALHGNFTIHGETREATVPGWAWITPTSARFKGTTPMNVKDYKVGGLKKMLGVLSMDERIVVRVDVTFGT